ncbi:Mth938-like domain-containing protein [Dechloromonas sp. ZY10]|uniref:Mth938-like domain-containing protein n=1 Tax=Dechloromonas aquae TaxID=2664436 RepID=UPI0035270B68
MKLHQTHLAGLNIFTAHGEGFVTVNHEKYEKSLIVTPENIVPAWTEAKPDALSEADMQQLMQLGVEVVLLGTGKQLRFPPGPLLRPFAPAGIGIEVMDLPAACRTYNILAAEGRKVAAALIFD